MRLAIWWIRRDIRLYDNQAVNAALNFGEKVIPLFIFDENILNLNHNSQKRVALLKQSLAGLNRALIERQSYLYVAQGSPQIVLKTIYNQLSPKYEIKIFAETDYSHYARKRDGFIQNELPIEFIGSTAFYPPGTILKNDFSPFLIFTPFSRAWKSQPYNSISLIPKPTNVPTLPIEFLMKWADQNNLASEKITPLEEDMVQNKLEHFTSGDDAPVYSYENGRNSLEPCQTSRLSPYLHFGILSIRHVVKAAQRAIHSAPDSVKQKSARIWLDELIWRDFYIHILYHFPQTAFQNFQNKHIEWINNEIQFTPWTEGLTGVPIVDAGMRQLYNEGWLPNRARMIVASFLTKDLLIDWRWGEIWFMQNLVDGDLAANIGGWQWSAGTGTDAVPYFRIMNPVLQSQKFDPQGLYIRKYIPELRDVPNKYIHDPTSMPLELQKKVKCVIGKDYPARLVDHQFARQRALTFFRKTLQEQRNDSDTSS